MGHECGNHCSHEHSQSALKNGNCSCQNCHCSCQHCQNACQGHLKYSDQLLHLADEAWMDILKDKIKEEIRLNAGEQLTQLAKLVATANHARWRDKMQSKKDYEDFELQLKAAMCSSQKK